MMRSTLPLVYSSTAHPCPVCGRTKDGDCRSAEGLVLCHTYRDGRPGQVIEGHDQRCWVYTKTTSDGLWGVWKVDSTQFVPHYKRPRLAGRKEYVYEDKGGRPLVRVVRQDNEQGGKRIHQESWNGSGWVKGGVERVAAQIHLYRITEARQLAEETGRPIFLVEGEACADALLALGIPATTSIGGAGKWHKYGWPNYVEDLKGQQVVLCPDCDQPGVKHMQEIERSLREHGIPICGWLLAPPNANWQDLPTKGGLDIVDWLEQGATVEQILGAVRPSLTEDDEELVKELQELAGLGQGFVGELLPKEIDKPLRQLARRMNKPIEAYYLILLCVAASRVNSQTRLLLDPTTNFKVPPILWGGLVGETGAGKTPIIDPLVSPLSDLQTQLEEDYQKQLNAYRIAKKEYERNKEALDPPQEPQPVDLYVSDFTLEAVCQVINRQKEKGLLVSVDELAAFIRSMDAYRKTLGADRARWLEIYNGRPLKVDRKTTGRVYAPHPSVSIVGGIQPSVLQSIWKEEQAQDGLWARFAWVRVSISPTPWIEEGPHYILDDRLKGLYERLGDIQPKTYRLDSQGKQLWNRWHQEIEQQILTEPNEAFRATLPKARERAARIALILHLINQALTGNKTDVIPGATLDKAIAFARWLQNQSRLIYAELGITHPESSLNLRFLNRFQGCGPITLRQVRNWWPAKKKPTMEEIRNFLHQLEQTGRLRWVSDKSVEVTPAQLSFRRPEVRTTDGRLESDFVQAEANLKQELQEAKDEGTTVGRPKDDGFVQAETCPEQETRAAVDEGTTDDDNEIQERWQCLSTTSPPPGRLGARYLGVGLHEKLQEIANEVGLEDLGIPKNQVEYLLDLNWVFALVDRLRAKAHGDLLPTPNLTPREISFCYISNRGLRLVTLQRDGTLQVWAPKA